MTRRELNDVYSRLEQKAQDLRAAFARTHNSSFGFYNGHYRKNDSGEYERDSFPIPEITVPGLCDIEIGLESITVSTKLSRERSISYDYGKISEYRFEAYGVEDYLSDFYAAGDTITAMIKKIRESKETDIGFSFIFPFDTDSDTMHKFVNFLLREEFFY